MVPQLSLFYRSPRVLVLFNVLNNISVYFLVWIFYFYRYLFCSQAENKSTSDTNGCFPAYRKVVGLDDL